MCGESGGDKWGRQCSNLSRPAGDTSRANEKAGDVERLRHKRLQVGPDSTGPKAAGKP